MIILIKSVVNKSKYKYDYNIFLENGLYKDKYNRRCFQMNVCVLLVLIKQVHQKSVIFVNIRVS